MDKLTKVCFWVSSEANLKHAGHSVVTQSILTNESKDMTLQLNTCEQLFSRVNKAFTQNIFQNTIFFMHPQ